MRNIVQQILAAQRTVLLAACLPEHAQGSEHVLITPSSVPPQQRETEARLASHSLTIFQIIFNNFTCWSLVLEEMLRLGSWQSDCPHQQSGCERISLIYSTVEGTPCK